jgi:hypothetical protein
MTLLKEIIRKANMTIRIHLLQVKGLKGLLITKWKKVSCASQDRSIALKGLKKMPLVWLLIPPRVERRLKTSTQHLLLTVTLRLQSK